MEEGLIEQVDRGIYLSTDTFDDEFYRLQIRYSRGIYSHQTALYFHDLTDRTPHQYYMTFPNNYHSKTLKKSGITAFYTAKETLDIGKIQTNTQFGRTVTTYNPERTIVDLFRARNKLNQDIVKNALREYLDLKNRNLSLLMKYAKIFRMEKILGERIEFLL